MTLFGAEVAQGGDKCSQKKTRGRRQGAHRPEKVAQRAIKSVPGDKKGDPNPQTYHKIVKDKLCCANFVLGFYLTRITPSPEDPRRP